MIQKLVVLTLLFLCAQVPSVHSVSNLDSSRKFTVPIKDTDETQKEIEAINTKIEQFYIKENINSLLSLYANQFTFSPEYERLSLTIKL